ncbi:hypothetical protein RB595_005376 [Gaeumannomyces hyphopodioides]
MEQLREKPLPPLPPPSPPRSPSLLQRPTASPNARHHRQHLQPDANVSSSLSHRRTGSGASKPGDQNSRHIGDFEFVDGSQLQVESSSDSDDFRPTNRRRPAQHGRSMSHPFPSLFSGMKKKKASRPAADAGGSRFLDPGASDDDSDDLAPGPKPPAGQGHPKHGQTTGSKDLTTGNCMTCGSLARWPKHLTVFRCTICVTVNDLRPTELGSRPTGEPKHDRHGENDQGSTYAQPVSLEHTKLLVRSCLRDVIASSLPRRAGAGASLATQGLMPPPTSNGYNRAVFWGSEAEAQDDHGGRRLFSNLNTPELVESPLEEPDPFDSTDRHRPPRSYSTSYTDKRPVVQAIPGQPSGSASCAMPGGGGEVDPRKIFRALEDYLATCFTSWRSLNSSFGGPRRSNPSAAIKVEEPRRRFRAPDAQSHRGSGSSSSQADCPIAELDPKLLLLGDFAENGMWWTGGQDGSFPGRTRPVTSGRTEDAPVPPTPRSLNIEWAELEEWYSTIINAGKPWRAVYDGMVAAGTLQPATDAALRKLEAQILVAQEHAQRLLLKATETLLKRPGRPLVEPADLRFLLLILANPLLSAKCRMFTGHYGRPGDRERSNARGGAGATSGNGPAAGQHSGIIKRILGMVSNSPNECHNQLINWLARYPEPRFMEAKDVVGGFLAYRLMRQKEKKQESRVDVTGGLIPNMSAGRSAAALHAALGQSGRQSKKGKEVAQKMVFSDDWQIKAAARVMSLIFVANNLRSPARNPRAPPSGHAGAEMDRARGLVHARGQLLPTSDFYMTLLDDSDLMTDFEAWESRRGRFSFCQYPFLLSIWAKIQILEHDAKRQMSKKARDAFFDTLMGHGMFEQYLNLTVRRDCLVEDSLRAVSEVIGSGSEDIKKGIRITFKGEEGVDAGGLRKEWFLLLVREVFNPDHGLFIYDEDSQFCYFNPYSFETSDQYFLVGVVLGLAIYNSTILDIALPPFAFRKLLAAAPMPAKSASTHPRTVMTYTLDDLAEFRPRLARGLRQLLEYDGDVESTFCLDFVVDVDKYGSIERVPLTPGGENKAVTNSNRREYVDLYVRHLLDTAVFRQFDPFKRGFFTVCGGNALSLFRPEEIELLVRGSAESLDISSLRTAAEYDGWATDAEDTEPTVRWFWELLEEATPTEQRHLLVFVTGSDRIPATGAASLVIRLLCLGDDCERYPTARTCFNTLALWRYRTKKKLARKLWDAVHESEGFGLK